MDVWMAEQMVEPMVGWKVGPMVVRTAEQMVGWKVASMVVLLEMKWVEQMVGHLVEK